MCPEAGDDVARVASEVRFGGQATFHGFRPGITSFRNATDNQQLTDTAYNDDYNKGAELSLYLEDDRLAGKCGSGDVGGLT